MNGIIPELRNNFSSLNNAIICFSGGLDSTVLLKNAEDAMHGRNLAVFAELPMTTTRQKNTAIKIAEIIGAELLIVKIDWNDMKGIEKNNPDRCYICKNSIYKCMRAIAEKEGIETIIAGENADDREDDRPGRKAGLENGISYPLLDLGIGRPKIISCINSMNLPFPMVKDTCMATRYSFGVQINEKLMRDAEECESSIREITGVKQLRVRFHDDSCTILTDPSETNKLTLNENNIESVMKKHGVNRIVIDQKGYK